MARSSQRRNRRDWRKTLFLVISILIVLSMLLSLVLTVASSTVTP